MEVTMKKIPKKNYLILIVMFCFVIIITFVGARFYNNSLKSTGILFKYAKHISSGELEQYLNENPSSIVYISDKYNLSNDDIEDILKNKIIEMNLYNNIVYMDIATFDNKFILKFNKKYKTKLDKSRIPTLIVYNDGQIENIYYSLDKNIVNSLDFGGIK